MKKVIIWVLCVLIVLIVTTVGIFGAMGYYSYAAVAETATAPELSSDGSLVIMSANIRRREKFFSFDKMDVGSHRWWRRAKFYVQNIDAVSPDILGAQEVQPGQYDFLKKHLVGYESVVGYKDDRGSRSESCPIFYNAARFILLDSGTFWLSETPEVMSKFEGSYDPRIATFVKLKDNVTGLTVAVFNTHPNWADVEARIKQLAVVAAKAKESDADRTVIIGDLNSERKLPGGSEGLAPIEAFLKDSKTFPGMTDYGATFNGYDMDPDGPMGLDYIFLPESTTVLEVGKVDKIYGGVYPSDHFPIFAKVKF